MPTSKTRHEIGVRKDLYERIHAIAQREGRPTQRQADIVLELGLDHYEQMRKQGKHPLARIMPSLGRLVDEAKELRR